MTTCATCTDVRGSYCAFSPCACECHVAGACPVCTSREENDLTATEGFQIVIDDSLPRYAYADGTDEECTYHERIEYAGEELRELRRKVAALENELDDLRAVARKAG